MIDLLLLLILVLSLFILTSNHPIYCLFCLILVFVNFSIILLFYNLEFLALSYIIVYVGAICVLFIFVILLLNIRVYNLTSRESFWNFFTTLMITLLLFGVWLIFPELFLDFYTNPSYVAIERGDVLLFGRFFYNYYWPVLLLTVLLLLLAVVATIAVSLKRTKIKKLNFSFFY